MLYNILLLNYEYPPLGGGAGIITSHLVEEFSAVGHNVVVLTAWHDGLKEEEVDGNKRIVRLHSKRKRKDGSNVFEMYSYSKHASRYVRQNFHKDDFDICIANFTLPGGNVALQMRNEIGLPYIIISHGHDIPWFYPRQMFFWHLLMYPVIKQICKRSSRNVLLTNEMKKIADSFLGKNRCLKNVVIPNGLHEQHFEIGEKPHDKLKILFVGRMVDQKDPFLFIKVMELLDCEDINYEAYMLGGGPLMKKAVYHIEKTGLKNIAVEGKVPHSVVIDRMKEAHILVAPSTHEAMSVSILEGLSCGLYVITTPISGNTSIVEENGVLIRERNPKAYVTEIMKFYKEKFEHGGYTRPPLPDSLLQQYSWQVVAKQYLDVVSDVVDEENP